MGLDFTLVSSQKMSDFSLFVPVWSVSAALVFSRLFRFFQFILVFDFLWFLFAPGFFSGSGRPWPALAGLGRPWQALADSGRPWQV